MKHKTDYIAEISAQHPDFTREMLELVWHLHDVEKACRYGALLETCTDYASIVNKVLRPMYIMDEIDAQKAKNERFLSLLVSMACLEKPGNGHAAVYYARQMLDLPAEKVERTQYKEHCKRVNWLSQSRFPDQLVVELHLVVRDANAVKGLLDYLLSTGGTILQAKAEVESASLCGTSSEAEISALYAVTCRLDALLGLLDRLGGNFT